MASIMTGRPGIVNASRTDRMPATLSPARASPNVRHARLIKPASRGRSLTAPPFDVTEHPIQDVQRYVRVPFRNGQGRHHPNHVLTTPEQQQSFPEAALHHVIPFLNRHFLGVG